MGLAVSGEVSSPVRLQPVIRDTKKMQTRVLCPPEQCPARPSSAL